MKKLFYLLILYSFLLNFSSCKVKQSITDVIVFDEDKNIETDKEEVVVNDTVMIADQTTITESIDSSLIIGEDILELKEQYDVVIILPLFEDSINLNWETHTKSDLEDFKIPTNALKSLAFIEGMIMALQENTAENFKLNIQIYDNEASYFKTNEIISKLSFKNVDFIVGPMYNKNIQIVSAFAKKNDIIMISPFSHSKKVSSGYRKYIMPKPSIDIHLQKIAAFIRDSIPQSNIKILYPNTSVGQKYSLIMTEILNKLNDSLDIQKTIKYAQIEVEAKTNDRRDFKIEDYLDEDVNNVVIILPSNSGFIHNMLTILNQNLKDYEITVFGMPNWKDSKTLRLDYFNNLNVHFTDTKWLDKKDYRTSNFIKNYKAEYKSTPTDDAFLAYDLFSFLSSQINEYGLSLTENISKTKYKGIYTNFQFKSTIQELFDANTNTTEFVPLRIENNALHVISFKDFKLVLRE